MEERFNSIMLGLQFIASKTDNEEILLALAALDALVKEEHEALEILEKKYACLMKAIEATAQHA